MAMYVSKDNHILVEEGVNLDTWTKKTEKDIKDLKASGGSGVTKEYVDGELVKKVSVIEGKGLSTKDFTVALETKLNGLSNYTHPTTSGNKHIPTGGAANQILGWSLDGTAVWRAENNTTYSASTTSALGLVKKCAAQTDSVATTIEGLVTDFNSLLAKLKAAGMM